MKHHSSPPKKFISGIDEKYFVKVNLKYKTFKLSSCNTKASVKCGGEENNEAKCKLRSEVAAVLHKIIYTCLSCRL